MPFLATLLAIASLPAGYSINLPEPMVRKTIDQSVVQIPFETLHLVSPELEQALQIQKKIQDPFNVSQADMCWKQRVCSSSSPSYASESMGDAWESSVTGKKTTCGWKACPDTFPATCGLGCAVSKSACLTK